MVAADDEDWGIGRLDISRSLVKSKVDQLLRAESGLGG
jgi:hypothetical protein